jgi:hypothetical protein
MIRLAAVLVWFSYQQPKSRQVVDHQRDVMVMLHPRPIFELVLLH